MKGIIDDVRVIGSDILSKICAWINAVYRVTDDMKSQTGGAMSLGLGMSHGKSVKQKSNVKSSTEAELVGVSDYLLCNMYLMIFVSDQGYEIVDNTLCQGNQITILMLNNGRNACTGNSCHTQIKCSFVKDRMEKVEAKIENCPSLQMVADFFTKPHQGDLFNKFRGVIMVHKPISTLQ